MNIGLYFEMMMRTTTTNVYKSVHCTLHIAHITCWFSVHSREIFINWNLCRKYVFCHQRIAYTFLCWFFWLFIHRFCFTFDFKCISHKSVIDRLHHIQLLNRWNSFFWFGIHFRFIHASVLVRTAKSRENYYNNNL